MTDAEIIEIIASWVDLTRKIDKACVEFKDLSHRAKNLLEENKRLRKRIKELEND